MAKHEIQGLSDEWYTPKYIFDALGVEFDLDPAHPNTKTNVPCSKFYSERSLETEWSGFLWLNPPFGGRNGLIPWIEKFINHGNGIMLTPDRTSAPWFKSLALNTDAVLFVSKKIKFIKPDGSTGDSPSTGTALFAKGDKAIEALKRAEKNNLGIVLIRH